MLVASHLTFVMHVREAVETGSSGAFLADRVVISFGIFCQTTDIFQFAEEIQHFVSDNDILIFPGMK